MDYHPFTANDIVRVPVHYDMWMRGETMAYYQRTYRSRKHNIAITVLKGVRSGKTFKVRYDELIDAQ